MGRSLGLAAYRALSWRKAQPAHDTGPERPSGELLWLHADNPERMAALGDLASRLRQVRPDLLILGSIPASQRAHIAEDPNFDFHIALSSDHPVLGRHFLDHWQPDMCIWVGGALLPNLVTQAADRDVPMILADVRTSDFPARRTRWLPDPVRDGLDCFAGIMVEDSAASNLVQRLGVPQYKITITGRLHACPSPTPVPDEDLAAIAQQLGSRQVWLAVPSAADDFETILTAHRSSLRLVHRLLLVVAVEDVDQRPKLCDLISDTGMRFAEWEPGDPIDDNCQILVTAADEDLGLWLRAAPLTFLTGSGEADPNPADPMEAASLGSALLYKTGARQHSDSYARLAHAGAARMVTDATTLGNAVVELCAPDIAAAMALAGWHVVTDSARMTDTLVDMAQNMMDSSEASHART